MEQYDLLQAILGGSDRKKREALLEAAESYKKFGKYEEVGLLGVIECSMRSVL